MLEYDKHDATSLAALVAKKEVTLDELLDLALAQVERLNPALNAVVLMQEQVARTAIAKGLPEGPFRGVPFLIKDLGCEAIEFPSHNGSRLLANTHYAKDSAIFERIRATGVVTFGRTTSPEGGLGPATQAAVYGGPTCNPWDLTRTPGGSSGGAGAAVAAGIVPLAHGSDGGGSVRIPASNCGLFGFKASRARFPDGPYVGEGWAGMAIDGFLSRSVRDAAAMMDACAGPDSGAPYHAPPMKDGYLAALSRPPKPLRIAVCFTSFDGTPIDPDCRAGVEKTARLLADLGHHLVEARPLADHRGMMRAWTKIVACGTALGIKSKLRALGRDLRDDDVENVSRAAMEYARGISGEDYLASVGKIHAYGREMAGFFDQGYDVLLSATMAEPPLVNGRLTHGATDFEDYRLGDGMVFAYSPFCAVFNASGQPAVSLPLHFSADGLPIGIHLAAAIGQDELLISLCKSIEQAAPWAHHRPKDFTN